MWRSKTVAQQGQRCRSRLRPSVVDINRWLGSETKCLVSNMEWKSKRLILEFELI